MSDCYIKLANVDMSYPSNIYNASTIKQEVFSFLRLEKKKELLKDVKAIKNFSMYAKEGDRIGIIGRNGSGKSTLLKTLGGIYPIEAGELEVKGKIRALFDLALGFDLESSGRENILYRGLLLGAHPSEIEEKMQEIIDFADIGSFINYPIRSYSSGMLVRLAFAVSTSIAGEILLLDEVVSAGDAAFQEKAANRIFDLMDQAKIMVFVSHDMAVIQRVCNHVILMSCGEIVGEGNPAEMVKMYLDSVV